MDWVKEMTKNPIQEEEVMVALLRMTKQLRKHLKKKVTGVLSRKRREFDPMVLKFKERDKVPGGDQEPQQNGRGLDQWQCKEKVGAAGTRRYLRK